MPRRAIPWQQRVRQFFDVGSVEECWPWRGRLGDEGYGRFRMGGRGAPYVTAHRAVYELLVGPVPPGLQLDHQCHNEDESCPGGACEHRSCVNPWHIEPATQQQNTLRGRAPSATNAAKTTCPNGHAYDVTYRTGRRTMRACRRCRNARERELRALRQ